MRTNKTLTLAVFLGIFCATIRLASGSACAGGEVGIEWAGPTNDPTAGERVFIEKVT